MTKPPDAEKLWQNVREIPTAARTVHPREFHARGASINPANRFEALHFEEDPHDEIDEDSRPRKTIYYRDGSQSIIARNNSPDVGFETSVNPYRGCEHGCVYCYARPTHEYLGFSAGTDFESRIMVKIGRAEIAGSRIIFAEMATAGDSDQRCDRPVSTDRTETGDHTRMFASARKVSKPGWHNHEESIGNTRCRFVGRAGGVFLYRRQHLGYFIGRKVTAVLEPRTSAPQARLDAVRQLRAAGIPVGVMVAPIIPGLTDHDMPKILAACAEAGAQWASYTIMRLPFAVAPLFERWLDEHFPERKEKNSLTYPCDSWGR